MTMFKDVEGYEGLYQINESGDIYSLRKQRVLVGGKYPNGYRFICLCKGKSHQNQMIHRLVAKAFLVPVEGKKYVNHKDGNKLNNHVSNLEWVTLAENLRHAVSIGLVQNQCKIIRETVVTKRGESVVFQSMLDCSRSFGHTKSWLGNFIRKHGNPCTYRGDDIMVRERRCC